MNNNVKPLQNGVPSTPDATGNHRMFPWHPGEPLPASGPVILIGFAKWSIYDHKLHNLLHERDYPGVTVFTFDADEVPEGAEFETIFPGIGPVFHTPVVGYWENGRLVETGSGSDGREIIRSRCGLTASDMDRVMAFDYAVNRSGAS